MGGVGATAAVTGVISAVGGYFLGGLQGAISLGETGVLIGAKVAAYSLATEAVCRSVRKVTDTVTHIVDNVGSYVAAAIIPACVQLYYDANIKQYCLEKTDEETCEIYRLFQLGVMGLSCLPIIIISSVAVLNLCNEKGEYIKAKDKPPQVFAKQTSKASFAKSFNCLGSHYSYSFYFREFIDVLMFWRNKPDVKDA